MVALGGACVVAQGVCIVAPGGCVWLLQGGHTWLLWGACVVAARGGMDGCCWGACMVALGGMHGCFQGGMHGCSRGAWDTTRYRDTINEWAVRILLECILVEV